MSLVTKKYVSDEENLKKTDIFMQGTKRALITLTGGDKSGGLRLGGGRGRHLQQRQQRSQVGVFMMSI